MKKISYRKIDIPGHPEPRACPVCPSCKRVSHPGMLPHGITTTNPAGDEAWTCSIHCAYVYRHGPNSVQRILHSVGKKPEPKPALKKEETTSATTMEKQKTQQDVAAEFMEKFKAIPGAVWADYEYEDE